MTRLDRGFTLTETMISLLVLGQILAVLSMSLSTGMRVASAQDRILRRADEMIAVQRLIDGRLEQLVLAAKLDDPNHIYFEAAPDRLAFVSRLPDSAPVSGPHHLSFEIVGEGKDADLWLIARAWSPDGVGNETGRSRLARAAGLRFTYQYARNELPSRITMHQTAGAAPLGFDLLQRLPLDCVIDRDVGEFGLAECSSRSGRS